MQIKSAQIDTSPMVRKAVPAPLAVEAGEAPAPQAVDSAALEGEARTEEVGRLSGDAGHRIGHFVRGMAHESMQHVRYLAGAMAFRNVGSAVGSHLFTPLAIKLASENAAIVGGVAIGGTVAMGALAGLAGYFWVRANDDSANGVEAKKSVFGKAADVALDTASALDALPNFIYPSVYGATEAQRQAIYSALDQLPLEDATASATMTVIPGLVDTGISGMAQPGASYTRILLDQSYLDSADRARDLVFHENGHAVDYSGGYGLLNAHNWRGPFGRGPFVSEYASGNQYEDFAETYEHYHNGHDLSHVADKAEVIERVNEQNALNRMADTPRVRTAGKRIGEALGSVPYLRDGLELAGSLVGPAQIYRGAGDILKGLETDDGEVKLKGKFNLATGLFLTIPGASPLALVSSVAGGIIKAVAKEDKEDGFKTANKWADAILSTSAGPIGMTVAAVQGELEASGLRFDDSHGFSSEGWKAARTTKANMLKGTLFTVGGAVGGSLAGAALGAAIAGRTGAALGGVWGQLAGGAIGLGVYGAARAIKQDKRDKHPLALTKGDKKFLRGTVFGAVGGGVAGTVAGTFAGKAFGQWAGSALGGALGGSAAGTVFGWGLALAGAYGGAKLGAGLGSGRLLGRELGEEDLPTSTLARPEVLLRQIQQAKEAENMGQTAPVEKEAKA